MTIATKSKARVARWWARPTIALSMFLVALTACGLALYRSSQPRKLSILVMSDREILLDGNRHNLAGAIQAVTPIRADQVRIVCSPKVSYQDLMQLIDALTKSGKTNISFSAPGAPRRASPPSTEQ